jgi:hypothetical protein
MKLIQTVWKKWKDIARAIAIVQARIVLTVFYFTLLVPIGLIFSLKKDELGIRTSRPTSWDKKKKQSQTLKEMRRQF